MTDTMRVLKYGLTEVAISPDALCSDVLDAGILRASRPSVEQLMDRLIRGTDPPRGVLTLKRWLRIKSRFIIEQAIREVEADG
jgi:hypothetical protein